MRIERLCLTENDFKNLKKVDNSTFVDFKPFQYQRLPYPVYFHSIGALIGMGNFYWAVVYDCLVVFRVSKMYQNYSCILYFSPISINDDIQAERAVFAALLGAGFSIRLTQSEAERLGINLRAVKAVKDQSVCEFIYSTKDVVEMQGARYKALRNAIHRFDRRGGTHDHIPFGDGVLSFIASWAKMKNVRYGNYIKLLGSPVCNDLCCTTLYVDGLVQGYDAVEKVGLFYNAIAGAVDHDSPFDLAPALHYYSISGFPDKDTLMTTGTAKFKGVADQKRRLIPKHEEMVFRVPAIGPVLGSYRLVESFL